MKITFKTEGDFHWWLTMNDPFGGAFAPPCYTEGWKLYFKGRKA